MRGTQYTIRGIEPEVDQLLRKAARDRHLSLNAYIVQELERIAEQPDKDGLYHDLDFAIGSMTDGAEVDEALADFAKIDEEMWR